MLFWRDKTFQKSQSRLKIVCNNVKKDININIVQYSLIFFVLLLRIDTHQNNQKGNKLKNISEVIEK